MTTEHQPDAFTLFSTFNKSKIQGKENEYWSKSEWPLEELRKLFEWAKTAERVTNQRGQECVVVAQKLMPRQSQAGNDYYLGVASDPKAAQAKPQVTTSEMPF